MHKILCHIFFFTINCSILHGFDYDLIVIGAGAAGTRAASLAHKMGKKVALIEKSNRLGGGRLWYGDIPFKTLYSFSNKIIGIKELEIEGLASNSTIHIGDGQVLSRVSDICKKIYAIYFYKHFMDTQINIIYGSPQFINNHEISVNEEIISAQSFLIATGAQSYIPDIPGIEDVPYLTRENFFDMNVVPQFPKSIIIIGGGPLGIELAKFLNQCRVKVTLLIKHAVLLPIHDYEIIEQLTNTLLKEGVSIIYNAQVTQVEQRSHSVKVSVTTKAKKNLTFESENLFIACGINPNTESLLLEKAGVAINTNEAPISTFKTIRKNAILINKNMQTSTPNIYACGDVTGVCELSRVAFCQATQAINNMYNINKNTVDLDYHNIPQVLFAYPHELASVGLSEQSAFKKHKGEILVYSYPYQLLERAIMEHTQDGIAKFICDKNGILLGMHIFGAYAGMLIDLVNIGSNLAEVSLKKEILISSSPSYRQLFYEVSDLCRLDVEKQKAISAKENPGWIPSFLTALLWE